VNPVELRRIERYRARRILQRVAALRPTVPAPRRKPRERENTLVSAMASPKQRAAARNNIKKAAKAAKRERTISHLPKKTRTALGKEGAKAAKKKRH